MRPLSNLLNCVMVTDENPIKILRRLRVEKYDKQRTTFPKIPFVRHDAVDFLSREARRT